MLKRNQNLRFQELSRTGHTRTYSIFLDVVVFIDNVTGLRHNHASSLLLSSELFAHALLFLAHVVVRADELDDGRRVAVGVHASRAQVHHRAAPRQVAVCAGANQPHCVTAARDLAMTTFRQRRRDVVGVTPLRTDKHNLLV